MNSIEERVAKGVEWLDANRPLWIREIDLYRLEMSSPCNCVLGQTFGNWWDRPDELAHDWPFGFSMRDLPDEFADDDEAYDALTAEWRRVITARREVDG